VRASPNGPHQNGSPRDAAASRTKAACRLARAARSAGSSASAGGALGTTPNGPHAPLSVHALSGYTGGGRTLIERWEDPERALLRLPFEAPYALDREHKHVPEMTRWSGLVREPQFVPAVGPFPTGMRVLIPLHAGVLARGASGKAVWEALAARYAGEPFVRVGPYAEELPQDERRFDPRACNDTNRVELHVVPNPGGHVLLVGLLDNLGKGAAGSAIQNLNLALGRPETEGLSS